MHSKEHVVDIYESIKHVIDSSRATAYRAVNFSMVLAYWHIGRIIVEEEQKGKERAEYGRRLIHEISKKLMIEYGEGFTETNLKYMRLFYMTFNNSHALRDQLSWTHYRQLLRVENAGARNFYLNESINSKWSTRELERQINAMLYERLILSKDKKGITDET